MSTRSFFGAVLILALLGASTGVQARPWVTAYYPGWELGTGSNGYLPVTAVDFSCMTHVVLFSLEPRSDGSLDSTSNTLSAVGAAALIKVAHVVGTKVLISVGGWATEPAFLGATASSVLNIFISNLVGIMRGWGCDGIDIDWEPLSMDDSTNYRNFAVALRSALQNVSQASLLTTTCYDGDQAMISPVQQVFDQINIMTYDMSGDYPGWVSWHNSPLFNGGLTFPGTTTYLPSVDSYVSDYKAAGVAPAKVGIGAELGGTVWEGLTLPDQLLVGLTSIRYDVPLYALDGSGIMQKYYSPSNYHWDSGAQASYLSIPGLLGLTGDFVSFDDSNSIKAKAAYIRQKKLGGIILYELGMGYPGDGTYPLLKSVKSAFADTTSTTGVKAPESELPTSPTLSQNYPNPFNPTTTISFTTPTSGLVRLKIYNELGEEVSTLIDRYLNRGQHVVAWNASSFASGVYICRLRYGSIGLSIKMLLLK